MAGDAAIADAALVELARELVGELAGGKLLTLALAGRTGPAAVTASDPEAVGGRSVQGILAHPESPTVLYDLGAGHFAEGASGAAPGPVLHSDQFSREALAAKGWSLREPERQRPQASEREHAGPGDAAPDRGQLEPHQVEDKLAQAIADGRATDQSQTLDGHGRVWNADRASLHADIVRQHLEAAVPVPSEGKAVLLGGLGHGKPEVLQKAGRLDPSRYHVVSTEGIKSEMVKRKMVPEVQGLSPSQSLVLVHPEAAHVAGMVASALAARRKNMVIDGTMASYDHALRRITQLRSAGYGDIRAIHVHTPVEKAVRRARGRSSRLVPAHALRSLHRGSSDDTQHTFEQVKHHADGFEHWDHSGNELRRVRGGGKPEPKGIMSVEDFTAARAASQGARRG